MDNLPVSYYGIHKTPGGVDYLHQGRGAANFISLTEKSPFSVEPYKGMPCPHLINVASPVPDRTHWSYFLNIFDDDLLKEMMPIPKKRHDQVPFVSDTNGTLSMILVTLSRMSSPIDRVVRPIALMTKRQILDQLSITNVAPLVLTGIEHRHQGLMDELATESRFLPRKLILAGDLHMVVRSPMVRINTLLRDLNELDLASLNWETIGSAILRRHAREEPINTPFIRSIT